ncbi:MAG: hypothetical protein ABI210_06590 [Abditibacteriaceae bacterium]
MKRAKINISSISRAIFIVLTVSTIRNAYTQTSAQTTSVFPDAPTATNVKSVSGKHNYLDIKIDHRVDSAPAVSYWLQDKVENVPGLRGILAYIPLTKLKDNPVSQPYFVFRGFGVPSLKTVSSVASYHATPVEQIYDPQFSYNGKSMLFKVGWPFDPYGSYNLYQWNFEHRTLNLLVTNLANQIVYPSPDGKWLGYITGGDTNGALYYGSSELVLHIKNLRSKKDVSIKQDLTPYGIAWSSLGTLLFTMPVPDNAKHAPSMPDEPGKYDWTKQPRPAIYEALPVKGLSQKLIDSAQYPVPSPDGNRIAYFGWSDKMEGVPESTLKAESKGDNPPHRVLAIFDRKTGKSKLAMDMQPYSMLWSHDGKNLIVLKVTGETEEDSSYNGTGDIIIIDTTTMQSKQIATLNASDYEPASRDFLSPEFDLSQITNDGRYLLVKKSDYIGSTSAFFHERKTFIAIELKTGQAQTFAQVDNDAGRIIGWDWHDMSTPSS